MYGFFGSHIWPFDENVCTHSIKMNVHFAGFLRLICIAVRDVPVNHPVLGICRVSHYPVLPGPGKIIDPSKFISFQSKY